MIRFSWRTHDSDKELVLAWMLLTAPNGSTELHLTFSINEAQVSRTKAGLFVGGH